MTEDQITALADAILDLAEADRGLVKSKLRALVQMHVINAERNAFICPSFKYESAAIEEQRRRDAMRAAKEVPRKSVMQSSAEAERAQREKYFIVKEDRW